MGHDEQIDELRRHVLSLRGQLEVVNEGLDRRDAENFACRLIVRALAASHPDPEAFERVLNVLSESWISNAIPSGWTDSQIDAVKRLVEGVRGRKTPRSP